MALIGISGKIGSGKDTVGRIIQYLTSKKLNKLNTKNTEKEFITFLYSNYIPEENHWQIKKFAAKLKQIVSILTGIPVENLEKQEVKDRVLGEEWNYFLDSNLKKHFNSPYAISDEPRTADKAVLYSYKYTVRQLLQEIGTEAMRNVIHPNIWVNALFSDYNNLCQRTKTKECTLPCYNTQEENQCRRYPNWIITDVRFPNEFQAIKDRGGITIRVNRDTEYLKCLKDPVYFVENYIRTNKDEKLELRKFDKEFIRKHCKSTNEHPSETALDDATFDYVIDNFGTIEELIEKVREILIKEGII